MVNYDNETSIYKPIFVAEDLKGKLEFSIFFKLSTFDKIENETGLIELSLPNSKGILITKTEKEAIDINKYETYKTRLFLSFNELMSLYQFLLGVKAKLVDKTSVELFSKSYQTNISHNVSVNVIAVKDKTNKTVKLTISKNDKTLFLYFNPIIQRGKQLLDLLNQWTDVAFFTKAELEFSYQISNAIVFGNLRNDISSLNKTLKSVRTVSAELIETFKQMKNKGNDFKEKIFNKLVDIDMLLKERLRISQYNKKDINIIFDTDINNISKEDDTNLVNEVEEKKEIIEEKKEKEEMENLEEIEIIEDVSEISEDSESVEVVGEIETMSIDDENDDKPFCLSDMYFNNFFTSKEGLLEHLNIGDFETVNEDNVDVFLEKNSEAIYNFLEQILGYTNLTNIFAYKVNKETGDRKTYFDKILNSDKYKDYILKLFSIGRFTSKFVNELTSKYLFSKEVKANDLMKFFKEDNVEMFIKTIKKDKDFEKRLKMILEFMLRYKNLKGKEKAIFVVRTLCPMMIIPLMYRAANVYNLKKYNLDLLFEATQKGNTLRVYIDKMVNDIISDFKIFINNKDEVVEENSNVEKNEEQSETSDIVVPISAYTKVDESIENETNIEENVDDIDDVNDVEITDEFESEIDEIDGGEIVNELEDEIDDFDFDDDFEF